MQVESIIGLESTNLATSQLQEWNLKLGVVLSNTMSLPMFEILLLDSFGQDSTFVGPVGSLPMLNAV